MARKAVLKRIRITPTGKLLRRAAGQNHFNAKESRRVQRRRAGLRRGSPAFEKKLKSYLA